MAQFPHQHEGKTVVTTLVGTYIRTSDRILYYGDLYKSADTRADLKEFSPKKARFVGGFRFNYERKQF